MAALDTVGFYFPWTGSAPGTQPQAAVDPENLSAKRFVAIDVPDQLGHLLGLYQAPDGNLCQNFFKGLLILVVALSDE